jgi:hypothetical protein
MGLMMCLKSLLARLLTRGDTDRNYKEDLPMGLWDYLKSFIDHPAEPFVIVRIPAERVVKSDPGAAKARPTDLTLEPDRTYLRVRLAQMFLARDVWMLKTWYPAVQGLARLSFGGQPDVEIPNLIDTSKLFPDMGGHADATVLDAVLVPTVPFSGGTISVAVGLMSVEGADYLKDLLGALDGLSRLLAVPQLSQTLSVAGPLATAVQSFLKAGYGKCHLASQKTYGTGELTGGYTAILRAKDGEYETGDFCVIDSELRIGKEPKRNSTRPVTGIDFMLLHFEVFEERDDWNRLSAINDAYKAAREAIGPQMDVARDRFATAIKAAKNCVEVTEADRRRIVTALKERFEQDKADLGVQGLIAEIPRDLSSLMKGAMSVADACRLGRLTKAEGTIEGL